MTVSALTSASMIQFATMTPLTAQEDLFVWSSTILCRGIEKDTRLEILLLHAHNQEGLYLLALMRTYQQSDSFRNQICRSRKLHDGQWRPSLSGK